jgi:hypothetical protein
MRTVTINVEKEHIVNATRKDSHRCMIADAIQEALPWAKYIIVDLQSVRFSDVDEGRRFIYMTPPTAQKALLQFDNGRNPKPFKFRLTKGHERAMRVRQANYKPKNRDRKTEKRDPHRVMPARFREFGLRQHVGV